MESHTPPPLPRLSAFRDDYGDPRPPGISRHITACVSCRKQKVKCDLQVSGVRCTRCKKRGLPCVVKRSLQMLLEDDATWKDRIDKEVSDLKARINRFEEHISLPPPSVLSENNLRDELPGPFHQARLDQLVPSIRSSVEDINERGWNDDVIEDSGPAAIPASVVSEVTKHSSISRIPAKESSNHDIISRGILTVAQAQLLFNYYMTKHDNYIYGVLEQGSTFTTTRSSSPVLLAAICAVASLHVLSSDIPYESCYEEFVRLSASHMFSSRNNLNDIRALCIGAFWLPDISWALTTTAVRIAAELQLHRAYRRAISGDKKAYVAARLYYLVHVCDHQFSIAYGRPPLTGEYEATLAVDQFLKCIFITEDDYRLISQVKLWSITSNVFATFSTDIQQAVPEHLVGRLQEFHLALDTHRLEWATRFKHHKHIGNYPRKGVSLHHHFAKLYLCSHAFRGTSGMPELSLDMREIADTAVLSAISILRSINNDKEFQSFMSDLPLYFDTMIAFASVFLFRISTSYSQAMQVDIPEILSLIRHSISVLEEITSKIRPAHLLARMTKGLKQLLQQFEEAGQRGPQHVVVKQSAAANTDMLLADATDTEQEQFDWTSSNLFEYSSLENYDFLSNHQMTQGFATWPMDNSQ